MNSVEEALKIVLRSLDKRGKFSCSTCPVGVQCMAICEGEASMSCSEIAIKWAEQEAKK